MRLLFMYRLTPNHQPVWRHQEEERLANVRDSLWKFSNIVSTAAVDDDRSAEEVRKTLENCDLDEAVAKFVANNSTGEKR